MQFETVFDVAEAGFKNWWFPAIGLFFVGLGALFVCFPGPMARVFSYGLEGRPRQAFSWTLLIFSVVWTVMALTATLRDYIDARTALTTGKVTVVEGSVTDFRPMPVKVTRMRAL
jgi:hypothetical protein